MVQHNFSHNLHILLGKNAEQNISRIKEYINKYGSEYVNGAGRPVSDFLKLLLLSDDKQFYSVEKKKIDSDVFVSGIEDEYVTELVKCETELDSFSIKELKYFFTKKFENTVNMQNRGDGKLHVCIHVPLFIKECWENTQQMLEAIQETGSNYTVDLLLIAADLASLYFDDEKLIRDESDNFNKLSSAVLRKIVETKVSRKYGNLDSIILVSNKNENGIALNLNHDSYANLVGEYALATTAFYNDIYQPAFLMATKEERPVLGLGISMLHFDRFYFVQYMLKKAYSHILRREGLDKRNVDINVVAPIVQDILGDNINVFTTLYNDEVKPRIDKNMPHDQIRAEIQPIIESSVDGLKENFLEYLNRPNMSLPEKRAVLAQLLGEDDVLLSGALVDGENYSIIDECRQEVLDKFVEANNALQEFAVVRSVTLQEGTEAQVMPAESAPAEEFPLKKYAKLSKDSDACIETAKERLRRIKEKRSEIKTCAAYIRNIEDQLKTLGHSIKTEEDSHKRLTRDGFEFEGNKYYLMPKNIEVPLDEDYVPSTAALPTEVDLRKQFTPIKNQGSLGSCTAFALVSIYEYIMKKNENTDTNLSELFAYHNARVRQGKGPGDEDGSSLYDVVMGMGEQGICLEKYHAYVENDNVAPSEEAYKDAEMRKVTKALNVERKIEHIKSAVSQGYPVAISLCIYDSFATTTGFVPYPSDEDRKGEAGYHAMVVCGYSDEERVFIVRNSWGKGYGDNGYCYVPYSYMGNQDLLNMACIITEISIAELKVEGVVENVPVSFNREDSKVMVAMLKNQVEEEKMRMDVLSGELSAQRQDYLDLVTRVGNPSTQRELVKGTKERFAMELAELNRKRTVLINERMEKLDRHEGNKMMLWKVAGCIAVAVFLLFSLLNLYIDYEPVLEYLGWFNALQLSSAAFLLLTPFLITRMEKGVPDDILPFFDDEIGKLRKWWFLSLIAVAVVYVLLALYKVIEQPLVLGFGWQLLLVLFGFAPFVCLVMIHSGIHKQIELSYDEKQKDVDKKKLSKEKELERIDTLMYVAGAILDKVTKLISGLNNTYSYLYSYVENLRIWYDENETIEETPPLNRQPFMSLTDNRCLDEYFQSNSDNLTSEIKLYELFRDYKDMSDRGIVSLKNSLKEKMKVALMKKTDDFSIYDYTTEAKVYPYVNNDYVNLDQQLQLMDVNSEIFVQLANRFTDHLTQNTVCKMLFRNAAENNRTSWDSRVGTNFAVQPMVYDIASQCKMFIIRIEGLALNEIVMLRDNE